MKVQAAVNFCGFLPLFTFCCIKRELPSIDNKSNTPLLDLLEAVPEPIGAFGLERWQSGALAFGIAFGIAIFISVLAATNSANRILTFVFLELFATLLRPFADASPLKVCLFFFVASLVVVGIHELGHLIAGLAVGLKFNTIQAGPIVISRQNRKFRIRFVPSFSGLTSMHVPSVRRFHKKLKIYIAAGPAINLITILFGIGLGYLSFFSSLPRDARMSVSVLVFTSAFAFINSILSIRYRNGLFSDGAKLMMLLQPEEKTWRWYSIVGLIQQQRRGARPRDWNARWLKMASYCWDGSRDALSGAWLAYISANDRKDSTGAAAYLEQCLHGMDIRGNEFRDLIATEAGVFHSWFRNDSVKAKEWFSRVRNPKKMPLIMGIRADVAREFALGNYSQALLHWNEGLKVIKRMANPTHRRNAECSWSEWRQEMEKRQSQAITPSMEQTS